MSDTADTTPAEPAAEPQSVHEVSGTLSRIAAESAEAPEPAGDPDPVEEEPVDGGYEEEVVADPRPEEDPEVSAEVSAEVPAEEPAGDPYAEFGGRETVEAALRLHQATKTEDGVIQLFLEAGKQLGVGLDKIEALFTGADPAAQGEQEYDYDTDPERPMTLKEFQEWQAQQQAEAQRKAQQEQVAQARAAAQQTIQSTVQELGLTMQDDATQVILTLGNKYLEAGSTDPEQVANAVKRGHADYLALIEEQRKEYLGKKKTAKDTVPKAPSGAAAPSAPKPEEPKDTAEAIKLARQRLREAGEIR